MLLLLALPSSIDGRAVSADSTSLPSADIISLVTCVPVDSTLPDGKCYDIRYCRTLEGLVLSCTVTILACVWFAVHRNIPAPKVDQPRHGNFFVRAGLFVWYKILDQRQAATVFVVTLLIPEWVLAWALRQWFVAHGLVGELETARAKAKEKRKNVPDAKQEVSESVERVMDDEALAGSSGLSAHPEHALLITRQSKLLDRVASRRCKKHCEDCGLHCSVDDVHKSECDQVAVATRVAKGNEGQSGP